MPTSRPRNSNPTVPAVGNGSGHLKCVSQKNMPHTPHQELESSAGLETKKKTHYDVNRCKTFLEVSVSLKTLKCLETSKPWLGPIFGDSMAALTDDMRMTTASLCSQCSYWNPALTLPGALFAIQDLSIETPLLAKNYCFYIENSGLHTVQISASKQNIPCLRKTIEDNGIQSANGILQPMASWNSGILQSVKVSCGLLQRVHQRKTRKDLIPCGHGCHTGGHHESAPHRLTHRGCPLHPGRAGTLETVHSFPWGVQWF